MLKVVLKVRVRGSLANISAMNRFRYAYAMKVEKKINLKYIYENR